MKARVKRRLETGETDYLLQNRKHIKVCEMHHTREDAERVLAAATAAKGAGAPPVVDGGANYEEI